MTNQQIYDRVKKHLLKQGEACMNESMCAYRNALGMKCAIGALIPDSKYSPEIEGATPRGVTMLQTTDDFVEEENMAALAQVLVESLGTDIDFDFLEALQNIHDADQPSQWESALKDLAEEHGLIP